MSKYLVLKGVEGLGDRLQCLLQAIGYCHVTGRTLVIDWRDSSWYHGPDNNVKNYFDIDIVNSMCIETFMNDEFDSDMSVYPSIWRDRLNDKNYEKYIYNKKYSLPAGNDILYKMVKRHDFIEDIIVYSGTGNRKWNWAYTKNVKFVDNIVNLAIDSLTEQTVDINSKYIGVHMRGGTKTWLGGKYSLPKPQQSANIKYPTLISYIRYLQYELAKLSSYQHMPIVVLSDSNVLVDTWCEYNTDLNNVCIPTHNKARGNTGIHKLSSDKMIGYTKHDTNVESIRDFYILSRAHKVVCDGMSMFSNVASKWSV